jgi:DNA polymerase
VRFAADARTDWREILGASAPPKPVATPGSAPSPAPVSAATTSKPISAPVNAPPTSGESHSTASAAPWPEWLVSLGVPAGLSIGGAQEARTDAAATLPSLDAIANATRACTACALHTSATHAVPGEGNPSAEFLCVGEAPGANEDAQGRPFVGDAGQLLTKILGAIQLQRDDVYICNVLKHRPPGNRDPLPDEVHACQPFLLRQLELVKPRVILALGRFAAQSLLQTTASIGSLRGQLHRFHGIPLIVTYHPAALLRNESWKRPAWEDVKLARRVLDAARDAADVARGA